MSYISEIFQRLNIQHIREVLLHGVESATIDDRPYKMRIDSAKKDMLDMLYKKFPDMQERERITDFIYQYASAIQDVYMEIGLQAGAILTTQIYQNITNYTGEGV